MLHAKIDSHFQGSSAAAALGLGAGQCQTARAASCPGGLFRLVTRGQARAEGFSDLSSYACWLGEQVGLRLEGEPVPKIRQGALCLNDPGQAQVCQATFEVSSMLNLPRSLRGNEHQRLALPLLPLPKAPSPACR